MQAFKIEIKGRQYTFFKKQIASLDVDAQNCFTPICPEELPVPDGNNIFYELNAQARLARYRVGSKDAHSPKAHWIATKDNPQFSPIEGENMDVRWNAHGIVGTTGFELIAGLPPVTAYDHFVWKGVEPDMHPYGACYHDLKKKISTGLIEWLRDKKVLIVIAGGLATEYCYMESVLELLDAGFFVIVNLGACRGLNKEATEKAIEKMKASGAVIFNNAAEIEKMFSE